MSRLLLRRQRDSYEAGRERQGFPEERRSCTSDADENQEGWGRRGARAALEVGWVAVEPHIRITGDPSQLSFLVFIPRLMSTMVSSLRAAVSSGSHPISKSTSTELCTQQV